MITAGRGGPGASTWAPLRLVAFRALSLAQLGSMVGTWMHVVGAQWLLVDEPNASTLVALVQTASLVPVLLLALPSGVVADSFDRFVLPGVSLWALLPVVASQRLGLGAGGYGLLLAAVGGGAVAGAVVLPRVRSRTSTSRLVGGASVIYAGALLALGFVRNAPLIAAVLVPAGAAWMAVLSSLGAAMQMFLPEWVRARGLSAHQVVFLGGQGIGAFAWGLVAQYAGIAPAFAAAAAVTALGAATLLAWPLFDASGLDRSPVAYWPEPSLAFEADPDEGPVLITLTFSVSPERQAQFLAAMDHVRRSRHRTGATRWGLYQDGADPRRFIEAFLVPSWQEHLRQHSHRLTGADQDVEEEALALADGPPVVAHLFRAPRKR